MPPREEPPSTPLEHFYKKHVDKKHEAEIRQKVKKHLRNIGRLSFK